MTSSFAVSASADDPIISYEATPLPRRTYYVPGHGPFAVKTDPVVTTLTADPEGGRHDVEVVALPRDPASTRVQVEIRQADQVVARELSLAVGREVVSRHQERYIDGTL